MKIRIAAALLLLFSACSVFSTADTDPLLEAPNTSNHGAKHPLAPPTKTAPSSVQIEKLDNPREATLDDIEILWKIPESAVDGFVIQFGKSKEDLDQEVKISIDEIEKLDHPKFGPTYRYLLHGFSKDDKVYVSVSAYSETYVSEPSEIFEVK